MASPNRTTPDHVAFREALTAEPYRFGFFAALRKLDAITPDAPRTGEATGAADNTLRLGQDPGLQFAPSSLAKFEHDEETGQDRLLVRFLGLFGPNGPLPLHLSEFVNDRLRHGRDATMARFMDVFHHRILSLFYRAWACGEPTVHLDRPDSDRFSDYVGSLFGMGAPLFRDRDDVSDMAKLHYAGRLAPQAKNAEGLQSLAGEFFEMPCRVEEFVGHWMDLPQDCQTALGGPGDNCTLGAFATLGSRVWDCQSKFRIVFGPINLEQFRRLLPGGVSLRRLIALVHNYIGFELLWDVSLILMKDEVPQTQLGVQGALGWTSFLSSRPPPEDSRDMVFNPQPLRHSSGRESSN